MKYNLVFTVLDGESKNENTTEKLGEFIYCELEIENGIEFCNVHRFGRFIQGKDHPIVAKFIYNEDRDLVMRKANRLKGSSFGIHEQFPKAVEDRRLELYPIMRDMENLQGAKNVKLVRDQLYKIDTYTEIAPSKQTEQS
jgi:hypothetical protein